MRMRCGRVGSRVSIVRIPMYDSSLDLPVPCICAGASDSDTLGHCGYFGSRGYLQTDCTDDGKARRLVSEYARQRLRHKLQPLRHAWLGWHGMAPSSARQPVAVRTS